LEDIADYVFMKTFYITVISYICGVKTEEYESD
jgi:hypothetical protein